MGIVTGGAIFNDPPAGPVADAFAVCAANPVFFLSEMALSAQFVAVVHIHFDARFGYQRIPIVLFVTGKTG